MAWRRRGEWGLVLVAAAFVAMQIAAVPLRMPLGWDEVVYASQVAVRAPASYFDAPRARGMTLLAAVAAVTRSTVVLRGWMSLLAGAGLVVAYWPWRRLLPGPVVVVAGALFASLWVVEFYADEVMPNIYVAYGTVAAVGWFLRAVNDAPGAPRWARAGPVGASVGFTALIRPSDAVFLAAPLLVAVLAVRAWRRTQVAESVASGLAVGVLPWIIEAYVRFGGLMTRLQESSAEQDGMRPHNAIGMELRALNGPTLCRPCDVPWTHPLLSLWWFATPLLACIGVLMARRGGDFVTLLLPAVCAAVVAAQYLLLIDYAAPRFLIPAYALLALPVASCLAGLVRRAPLRVRPTVTAIVALALLGHTASQYSVLRFRAHQVAVSRARTVELASRLAHAGLRPPCTLAGADLLETAYYTGCAWQRSAGPPGREAVAQPVGRPRPEVAHSWKRCSLVLRDGSSWDIYLAPVSDVAWRC
jgi:hypothetical protein